MDRDPEPEQAEVTATNLGVDLREQTGGAGDTSPSGGRPVEPTLLVAHYADARTPPDVYEISALDTATALREAGDLVERLARSAGGRLPSIAIRELISNLAHAGAGDAVVSLLDGGNTLRVADRGPGLPDKERALLPGFTTAGQALRPLLRGVGSGLGIARECLTVLGGTLELDDNLGGGTVVTARVPAVLPETTQLAASAKGVELSERQLRTLLIILELGPVGPTPVARELRVSPSTAYRDLVLLEEAGLVSATEGGLRAATDEGLAYLQTVL